MSNSQKGIPIRSGKHSEKKLCQRQNEEHNNGNILKEIKYVEGTTQRRNQVGSKTRRYREMHGSGKRS